jgi:AcrR family transcriptional regulator
MAATTSPPRRGRQERGEQTRLRLLEAAIDVFGRHGYEASTRELASAAGVNVAMIPYHFGSKHGLYLAAADHIAAGVLSHVGGAFGAARQRLADGVGAVGADEARQLLVTILTAYAHMLLEPGSAAWARFIIREQMEPSQAFERLYSGFMEAALATITQLVGRATGRQAASRATRLRAMSLMGQVLMFRAAHTTAMRQLGWTEIGERELAVVRAAIRESVGALESAPGGTA